MKKCVTLIIILFVTMLCLAMYKTFLGLTHPIKYVDEISQFSEMYDIDKSLVASVINVESRYKKNAISSKNAFGLMQIKLQTANYMANYYGLEDAVTESELLIPAVNIKYGCMYLSYLINKFGNYSYAICAYNAGETKVRSWINSNLLSADNIKNIPYKETKNYIIKVRKNLKYYTKIYNS